MTKNERQFKKVIDFLDDDSNLVVARIEYETNGHDVKSIPIDITQCKGKYFINGKLKKNFSFNSL